MNAHLASAPVMGSGDSHTSWQKAGLNDKDSDALLTGLMLLMLSIWAAASLTAFHALVKPVGPWLFGATVVASATLLFYTLFLVCRSFLMARDISLARRLLGVLMVVLAMTAFVIQGTTASARHDEIYSWNLWAIQHWQGVPYDLSYTRAPYPQLFSYWQASFYGAQNGIESQLLPRLATAVPTWILVACFFIVSAGRRPLWKDLLIGALWIFLLIDTWHTLRMGYADPLAIAALSVSLLCVLRYDQTPSNLPWLVAAALLGAMAAAIKQPGVIWACFCLPCLTLWKVLERQWPKTSVIVVLLAAAGVAGWLLLSMPDVADNDAVMLAAFRDRTVLDTVLLSIDRYLLQKPEVLLVLGATVVLSMKNPVWWRIVLFGLLPFIGIWFTLGSYEYRHGVHVMWLSGILIATALITPKATQQTAPIETSLQGSVQGSVSPASAPPSGPRVGSASAAIPAWLMAGAIVIATTGALHWTARQENRDISDGQRTGFSVQMEHPQAARFHQHVVDNQLPVWVTTQYTWGFFYGRVPIGRPTVESTPTQQWVRDALLSLKAAYAISSGDYSWAEYSQLLVGLTQTCPDAFFAEFTSRDKRYTVYRVDLPRLEACQVR